MEFGTFRRTTRGRSNADFTGLTLHLEPSPFLRSHISQQCTDSGLWSLAAVLRTRAVCRVARFWGVTVCPFVDSFRSAGGSKLDPCSSSAVTKPISNGLLRPTRQTPAPCCILLHGSENRQNGYAKPEFENAFSAVAIAIREQQEKTGENEIRCFEPKSLSYYRKHVQL